ncbi:N-acetylmuramoyl-L-alanine amidase [Streptomyces sp. NPDC004111]|uniref:N-acetylmuramoyl-L-alanine amidase n=1 Tax=Streptomyces sp. NPDC004111 TaxID=3364690 RepID=UPI0036C6C831
MRALVGSSIALACASVLALTLVLPDGAPAGAGSDNAGRGGAQAAELPGSTRSVPLAPLGGRNADGPRRALAAAAPATAGAGAVLGVNSRDVAPFSLVGVVWDDPRAALRGQVQVRTRAVGGRVWSGWQDLAAGDADHGADLASAEANTGRTHGSTAPLWVGPSDGVEARVLPRAARTGATGAVFGAAPGVPAALPRGLRLDLVDPGAEPRRGTLRAPAAGLEIPELDEARTRAEAEAEYGAARPHIGPRPRIVTRKGWGADEKLKEKGNVYTKTIKVAFVHHSASGNGYSCSQSGSVLRSIYRYHVKSSGWRDFGYNFAVDKCGNVYEGRAGGVAKPVLGAHTLGFNTNSMGIAVLGTYTHSNPPAAAVNAVAKLAAWKLGLHGANPKATTHLTSGGSNLYKKGRDVRLNVISGHRDGFATECPGGHLYRKLGTARGTAARLQGR